MSRGPRGRVGRRASAQVWARRFRVRRRARGPVVTGSVLKRRTGWSCPPRAGWACPGRVGVPARAGTVRVRHGVRVPVEAPVPSSNAGRAEIAPGGLEAPRMGWKAPRAGWKVPPGGSAVGCPQGGLALPPGGLGCRRRVRGPAGGPGVRARGSPGPRSGEIGDRGFRVTLWVRRTRVANAGSVCGAGCRSGAGERARLVRSGGHISELREEAQACRAATLDASADFLLAAAFLWMTPFETALSS